MASEEELPLFSRLSPSLSSSIHRQSTRLPELSSFSEEPLRRGGWILRLFHIHTHTHTRTKLRSLCLSVREASAFANSIINGNSRARVQPPTTSCTLSPSVMARLSLAADVIQAMGSLTQVRNRQRLGCRK